MEDDKISEPKINLMFKLLIPVIIVSLVLFASLYLFNKYQTASTKTSASTNSSANIREAANKSYTLAEISAHATETDCWMAISGKVYNVTSFILQHPGGAEILRGCGIDATQLYKTQGRPNGHPHPRVADNMLKDYIIGMLKN